MGTTARFTSFVMSKKQVFESWLPANQ